MRRAAVSVVVLLAHVVAADPIQLAENPACGELAEHPIILRSDLKIDLPSFRDTVPASLTVVDLGELAYSYDGGACAS